MSAMYDNDRLNIRIAKLEDALRDVLSHCDANPEGESDFERAVIKARAVLSTRTDKP